MAALNHLSNNVLLKLKENPKGLTFNELTNYFPYWDTEQFRNLLYRMIAKRLIRTKPITEEHKKKAKKYYSYCLPSKVYVAR